MAMHAPENVLSQELVNLQQEISAQGKQAAAIVFSKSNVLVKTSEQIPTEITESLDRFFGDARALRLFISRYKNCQISWNTQNRMRSDDGMRLNLLRKNESAYAERYGKFK
jgi:hypothetical protein